MGEVGKRTSSVLNPRPSWMRVNVCTRKERGFKKLDFGGEAPHLLVLYPTAHTQIIRSRLALLEGWKGDCSRSFLLPNWVLTWDMGVYLSPWDAHSPLYHVDWEADYNAYYLAPSWRKSYQILTMGMLVSSLRCDGWCSRGRRPAGQLWVWDLVWKPFVTCRRLFDFLNRGNQYSAGLKQRYGVSLWQKVKPEQLEQRRN